MTLPTLSKTWQFVANQQVITGGPLVGYGALMYAWKTALTSFASSPWVVVASSDASSAGAADYWTSASACNTHRNPGTPHCWIVLKQVGVASNFQICIDLNNNSGSAYTVMRLYISESAGFTGGTTSNRPTATDEVDAWAHPSANTQSMWTAAADLTSTAAWLHVAQSTDGEITRWWIFIAGTSTCFVNIEKPRDVMAGWTLPWICTTAIDEYSGTNYVPTYAYLNDLNDVTICRAGGADTWLYYTSEGCVSSMLGQQHAWTAPLDGNALPFFPIGLYSPTTGRVGRLGALTDIWWGSTIAGTGDYYPADLTRQFVQLYDLIVPWTGGIMMRT